MRHHHSISGLVVEYIVAIDVTRVRFPADAIFHFLFFLCSCKINATKHLESFDGLMVPAPLPSDVASVPSNSAPLPSGWAPVPSDSAPVLSCFGAGV